MKKILTLKYVIIGLSLVTLGVVSLYCSKVISNEIYKNILDDISSTLLVTGLWSIYYEYVMKKDFIELLESQNQKSEAIIGSYISFRDNGLTNVYSDYGNFDFANFIAQEKDIYIIIDIGYIWIYKHKRLLNKRAKESKHRTTIILSNPENQNILNLLAHKLDTNSDTVKNRIVETIDLLKGFDNQANLTILLSDNFINYKVFFSEDYGLLVPYTINRAKDFVIPIIKFSNENSSNFFNVFQQDLQTLIKQKK